MVFTTVGKNKVALSIGSSAAGRPQYFALGSGSGTALISNVGLVWEIGSRRIPSTTDIATDGEVKYIGDWNSVDMSGIDLKEFGMFTESATAGSCWNREGFKTLNFDGTNELQIQLTYQVY